MADPVVVIGIPNRKRIRGESENAESELNKDAVGIMRRFSANWEVEAAAQGILMRIVTVVLDQVSIDASNHPCCT